MCACLHVCIPAWGCVAELVLSFILWVPGIELLSSGLVTEYLYLLCPSVALHVCSQDSEFYVPWWHFCYICGEPAHLCGHFVRTSVDLGWPLQVAGAHFTLMRNITWGAFWLVSFTDALGSWSFNAVTHMVVFEICWLVSYLCALVLLSCLPSSLLLLVNLIFSPKQKFGTL